MKEAQWNTWASILICIAVGAGLLVWGGRVLLPLFLPFLIALALAGVVRPIADYLSRRCGLPRRLLRVLLFLLLLGGIAWGIGVGSRRLLYELRTLVSSLLEDYGGAEGVIANATHTVQGWSVRLGGFLASEEGSVFLEERLAPLLDTVLERLFETVSTKIPNMLGKLLSALPDVFVMTLITVIAGVYFCIDGEGIFEGLLSCLPKTWRVRMPTYLARLRHISWRYLRAYLGLLLLTFIQLFLGFCMLRFKYAFLLGLAIAIVDMLPILGVGTVLLPWAGIAFLQHDPRLGIGLLILYASVLICRQIFEPRLVGKSLGLHPLLTLFAGYVGWQSLGLLGMAAGPIVALLLKTLLTQWRENDSIPLDEN